MTTSGSRAPRRLGKTIVAISIVAAATVAFGGPAFGHSAVVTTPSGQSNCQFMGGTGNPGHEGHSHGHTQAQAHEQSGAFAVGSC